MTMKPQYKNYETVVCSFARFATYVCLLCWQACVDLEKGEPPSQSAVRETVLTVILIMLKVGVVALVTGLICYYMGWMFAFQLCLVALVAYLAAGGGYRWFYVAFKTLPRDTK